ncbi:tRNA (adenosine(37)-N6)-threonylcarbamoyltransferase complex transferase subunit TsaD, partial [Patescibacteria group bacterium]|nr:tRNA (adenosine(37)-N6)-threonylcarbamoyltransferase complex transferase subunit TsaD [Patescibacteria group bacterium]
GNGGIKKPCFKVLKNIVSSQIKIHRPFGGVVPMLAKREHLKNLPKLLKILNPDFKKIDLIGVTVGPGLEPALWTGINFAKELAEKHKKKIVGANHMEAHLDSFLFSQNARKFKPSNIFPAVALIVSGGHTILLRVDGFDKWKKLGETRDDAAGEAFDKVARLLSLPYPGGPEVEKMAKKGDAGAVSFPRPMINQKNYDFSFSGLKTAVLYYLRDLKGKENKTDVAAGFQAAVIDVLAAKTFRAAEKFGAESVLLSGGVAANKSLRKALGKKAKSRGLNFFAPEFEYNTDNGAMVAAAAYFAFLRNKKYRISAQPNLGL